ncbi:RimK family protein [Shumkonia mesophila]|uniref:RimK family protein n=1 Tax=Shumkonia mesophila TaxID=2838854 RepID=UPI0029344E33|nr:RimK family protein [Shumkonia mesophila]
MTHHIVIVESAADRGWAEATGAAVTAREYVTGAAKYGGRANKVVNLSGQFEYMKAGYYCSLLAEARGQRVIPTVQTILELSRKALYAGALPEIDAALAKTLEKLAQEPRAAFSLTVIFGQTRDSRFRDFARRVFDRFRAPLMTVRVVSNPHWHVAEIDIATAGELSPEEFDFFLAAMEAYTRSGWRPPRARTSPRYTLAVLHNPHEHLPPSSQATLKKFTSIGAALGIGVELIQRKDFLRLAEFDALFIRETTTLKDHTYRFAMRAEAEGMPVIDDVTSILRCTNKVYLAELLHANNLPAPKTLITNRNNVLDCETRLGYPVVLKIPDGSFSRGVHRVADREELLATSKELFRKSDLILAQEYMYTKFDWRVGVLNRKPLFVSQYFMSRRHWQIVNHTADGRHVEGDFKTMAVEDAPKEVVAAALRAAGLIGDGLYGVDLKQTKDGVFVIEINDNPNLDRGVEDVVLKDDLYRIVLGEFIQRIEHR